MCPLEDVGLKIATKLRFYNNGIPISLNRQWHRVLFFEIKIRPRNCKTDA